MIGSEAKKVVAGGLATGPRPDRADRPPLQLVRKVEIDRSRDSLLTDFGKTTLEDRYLLPGESYQDMFARVATAYADDADHAQRIYDYISKLWLMGSTPVLSNGGAGRGLPISCFLNAVGDSLESIVGSWNENVFLAANGGGIGTYWGGVRSIGEKVKGAGQTSGIIPFIRVMDSMTLAISQGSLRRGNAAVYIDIWHPEIDEFLEIRKPSGDFNRKSLNLHHGVCITDEFMEAVRDGARFALRSPKTGETIREVDARALWQKLLELRLATGEPYLIFSDTANRALPQHQRELGLKVRQSNLCSEIMLHSGPDHLGPAGQAVRGQQPATAGSGHAERVRLVGDQHRVVRCGQRGQRGDRRGVAEDGIDRLHQHQRPALRAAGQRLLDRGEVIVRGHDHGGAREAAGVDHRGVDVRVGDDQGIAVGQRLHDGQVGVVARGEHQRAGETGEHGHRLLEFGVDRQRSRHQARGGRSGAVSLRGRDRPGHDPGVAGQAQVVVSGQVEQGLAAVGFGQPAGQPAFLALGRLGGQPGREAAAAHP